MLRFSIMVFNNLQQIMFHNIVLFALQLVAKTFLQQYISIHLCGMGIIMPNTSYMVTFHVCRCRLSRLVESWEGLLLLMLTDVSIWLGRCLLLRLLKCQSTSTITVLLRTLLTWTIYIYKHVTILLGSNHLLYLTFIMWCDNLYN